MTDDPKSKHSFTTSNSDLPAVRLRVARLRRLHALSFETATVIALLVYGDCAR